MPEIVELLFSPNKQTEEKAFFLSLSNRCIIPINQWINKLMNFTTTNAFKNLLAPCKNQTFSQELNNILQLKSVGSAISSSDLCTVI